MPKATKLTAEKQEKIFKNDLFDKRLKTHKLHGKLRGFWSFSINDDYRIIFELVDENIVHFHAIGRHDIYNRERG